MRAVKKKRLAVGLVHDGFLELFVTLVIAPHETNLDILFAGGKLSFHDPLAGVGLRSQRLLAEHIFAGGDGRQNDLFVELIGRRAHNRVNIGIRDQFFEIRKALQSILICDRQTEFTGRIRTGCHFRSLQSLIDSLDVCAADPACTDQTDTQYLFCHDCSTFSLSLYAFWFTSNEK